MDQFKYYAPEIQCFIQSDAGVVVTDRFILLSIHAQDHSCWDTRDLSIFIYFVYWTSLHLRM